MAKNAENNKDTTEIEPVSQPKSLICGIIMPIADIDGYPVGHWKNVHDIICEASISAGFKANLVSSDDDVAVIQKRIVQNIYDNPIVVCDISARNANVMFELGMRLAFDKPTVIIKDERTPYSFDISSIEHLEYPSDLRYQSINIFKDKLAGKIKETYSKSVNDPNYTTFLKHFGTFKIAQLDQKEVSESEYLASEIKDLKSLVISLISNTPLSPKSSPTIRKHNYNILTSEVDHSINIRKISPTVYVIEPIGFELNKNMCHYVVDQIMKTHIFVDQFNFANDNLRLNLRNSLTKEDEDKLKDIIVTSLL